MLNPLPERSESTRHLLALLQSTLGPHIGQWLADPDIIEILVNPDGRVWTEALTGSRQATDVVLNPNVRRTVIEIMAAAVDGAAHGEAPLVSAELPESGHRFQGVLPPVVEAPVFCIRRRASLAVTLDDYVEAGALAPHHAERLHDALRSKHNILVAGGTGSGKTTLTNALLRALADTEDRLLVIEDIRELQVQGQDCVALRAVPNIVDMAALLRAALRLRPDRIIVGEVRGGEALTLIKSWNTGHPGGISTLHADDAPGALSRLEQLIAEVTPVVPKTAIAEAVDLIAVMARTQRDGKTLRVVTDLVAVEGLDDAGHYQLTAIPDSHAAQTPLPLTSAA